MNDLPDHERRIDDTLDSPEAGGMAIRGSAIRLAGYGAAALLGLISVPLLTRHLGPDAYGQFVAVTSIAFIVGGFTDAGLTNIGIREYAVRDAPARDRLLRGLLGLRLVVTVAGVLVATSIVAATGAAAVIVAGTVITGAALVLTLVQITYTIPLTADLRFGRIAALDVLRQAATTAGIAALVVAGASLVPFFWVTLVAAAVTLAVTLAVVARSTRVAPRRDREVWRSVLREAVPYTVALAGGILYFRLAVVLMTYLAPEDETGYYATAFRITEVIGVLPWLAVSSAFPILSRAAVTDGDRMRWALQQLFEVSVVVGTALALGLAVGAPVAVAVIAGPEFDPAVDVLRVLAIAQLTLFLVATWVYALLALRQYRVIMVSTLAATVVAAAGTVVLVGPLGAMGAAIATAAADATLAACYLVGLVRHDRALRPHHGFLPRYALLLAVAVAVAALLWSLPLVAAIVSVGVYLGGAFALKLVPAPLVQAFPLPSAGRWLRR